MEQGTEVITPNGRGKIAFVRMGGPTYTTPEAVSVVLDNNKSKVGYTGTIFPAHQVERLLTMSEMAKDALNVLNAGNISGMVNSFARVLRSLRERLADQLGSGYSTRALAQHPISILYTQAISNITQWDQSTNFQIAYEWSTAQANSPDQVIDYPTQLLF